VGRREEIVMRCFSVVSMVVVAAVIMAWIGPAAAEPGNGIPQQVAALEQRSVGRGYKTASGCGPRHLDRFLVAALLFREFVRGTVADSSRGSGVGAPPRCCQIPDRCVDGI
jgi:hypothetical protein